MSRKRFDILWEPPQRRPHLAFDIETRGVIEIDTDAGFDAWQRHDFLLGVVTDGKQFWHFRSRQRMIHFFLQKRWRGYVIWATNLEYDFNGLFPTPEYPVQRFKFGSILKSCRFVTEWKRDKRTGERVPNGGLDFYDTLNHWPASVAKLGKKLGFPKLEAPFDSRLGPQTVTPELIDYCERDTLITWTAVEKFQELYLEMGCELKSSIAASAMDLFRREFMDRRHAHLELPKSLQTTLRKTYFGGRTEAFELGRRENVNIADINSMYPSIMAGTPLPILGYRKKRSGNVMFKRPILSKSIPENKEGVACVTLRVPDDHYYPSLPVRRDKVYFPTGRWTGWYTLGELRYADSVGVVIEEVRKCLFWEDSDFLFQEYVEALYGRRKATPDKEVEGWMYKLFLNALYGKFGMAGTSLVMGPEEVLANPKEMGEGWFREDTPDQTAPYSNFIWASYITSGARTSLHRHLVNYESIYTDTDSCFTYKEVEDTDELGALSFESKCEWVDIMGPKNYKTPAYRKVKGVPQRAIDTERVIELGDGLKGMRYQYKKPLRFNEAVGRGKKSNSWVRVEKILLLDNDKRCFDDGGMSRPWTYEEIDDR